MYHYLKWAALSYFFKRNLRYLILIGLGFLGIYIADAVYEDLADFATRTGQTERIALYLAIKWIVVLLCGGLILFSIFRLGLGRGKEEKMKGWFPRKSESRKIQKEKIDENVSEPDDPLMQRLEKFRNPKPLRRKSDMVIGKKKR